MSAGLTPKFQLEAPLKVGDVVRVLPIVLEAYESDNMPAPGVVSDMVKMIGKEYPITAACDWNGSFMVDLGEWTFRPEWVDLVAAAPVETPPRGEALEGLRPQGTDAELVEDFQDAVDAVADCNPLSDMACGSKQERKEQSKAALLSRLSSLAAEVSRLTGALEELRAHLDKDGFGWHIANSALSTPTEARKVAPAPTRDRKGGN